MTSLNLLEKNLPTVAPSASCQLLQQQSLIHVPYAPGACKKKYKKRLNKDSYLFEKHKIGSQDFNDGWNPQYNVNS